MEGSSPSWRVGVSEKALDPAKLLAEVGDPTAGAVVLFLGTARDHSDGKDRHHPSRIRGLSRDGRAKAGRDRRRGRQQMAARPTGGGASRWRGCRRPARRWLWPFRQRTATTLSRQVALSSTNSKSARRSGRRSIGRAGANGSKGHEFLDSPRAGEFGPVYRPSLCEEGFFMTAVAEKAEASARENVYQTLPEKIPRMGGAELPNAVAMREKDFGIWQEITWAQLWENVLAAAHGLLALGDRARRSGLDPLRGPARVGDSRRRDRGGEGNHGWALSHQPRLGGQVPPVGLRGHGSISPKTRNKPTR